MWASVLTESVRANGPISLWTLVLLSYCSKTEVNLCLREFRENVVFSCNWAGGDESTRKHYPHPLWCLGKCLSSPSAPAPDSDASLHPVPLHCSVSHLSIHMCSIQFYLRAKEKKKLSSCTHGQEEERPWIIGKISVCSLVRTIKTNIGITNPTWKSNSETIRNHKKFPLVSPRGDAEIVKPGETVMRTQRLKRRGLWRLTIQSPKDWESDQKSRKTPQKYLPERQPKYQQLDTLGKKC